MSHSITIKFFDGGWLPFYGDRYEYHFMFDFIDTKLSDTPEEMSQFQSGGVMIGVSGTLASCWGFPREGFQKEDLKKVLYELTKRHVKNKIKEGSVEQFEELQLNTGNIETERPYDPNRVTMDFGEPIIVITEEVAEHTYSEPEIYAEQIISLRDHINALSKEKLRGQLLMLPQERAIIELYKKCSSVEEFSHRVSALEELATAFNTKLIRKILGVGETNLKSIALLKELIECHIGLSNAEMIIAPLKHLNRLRQGYPRHTDTAEGVLNAYRFFNIEYPIKNCETSWRKLLEHYRDILDKLYRILRDF